MARRSSIDAVLTGTIAALRGSSGVTALISSSGVYNNVVQDAPYPYVVVTSPTDTAVDTMGRFGSSVLVDVRAVSQYAGDREAARVIDQCEQALNFASLSLSALGHSSLGITWESGERYQEIVNGIPTRHHVATFRVWTEQSSS